MCGLRCKDFSNSRRFASGVTMEHKRVRTRYAVNTQKETTRDMKKQLDQVNEMASNNRKELAMHESGWKTFVLISLIS